MLSRFLNDLFAKGQAALQRRWLRSMLAFCLSMTGLLMLHVPVIDGVAGATQSSTPPPPAPPNLILNGSVAIKNHTTRVEEGKPLNIDILSTDPVTQRSLTVGVLQNGNLYTDSGQSGLTLPDGATLTNTGMGSATFSWTPAVGSSATSPSVTLTFASHNAYFGTTTKQVVTILVDDNLAPSFDEGKMSQLPSSVAVDHALSLPITVNADPDNDSVQITSSKLPAGASLGKAVLNAGGQWVSMLNWTPKMTQLGKHYAINLQAVDDQVNPAQASYPLNLSVVPVVAPTFDVSLLAAQNFIVNKKNQYRLIVNADAYSKQVTISVDGVLPKGASLSKAKKVNGQWLALLNWKPSPTQLGDYPITLIAQDPAAQTTSASAARFTVTVSVVAQ